MRIFYRNADLIGLSQKEHLNQLVSSVLAFEASSILVWKYFKNEIVAKGLTDEYVFGVRAFVKGHFKRLLGLQAKKHNKYSKYVSVTEGSEHLEANA